MDSVDACPRTIANVSVRHLCCRWRGSGLLKSIVRTVMQSDVVDLPLCMRLYSLLRAVHASVGVGPRMGDGPDLDAGGRGSSGRDSDDEDDVEDEQLTSVDMLVEALRQCRHSSADVVCPQATNWRQYIGGNAV